MCNLSVLFQCNTSVSFLHIGIYSVHMHGIQLHGIEMIPNAITRKWVIVTEGEQIIIHTAGKLLPY